MDWLATLLEPLMYPLDPSRRIFIGFIFVALIMAYFVYRKNSGNTSLSAFLRYFFDKKIWGHRSSIVDFKLLFVNAAFATLVIAPFVIAKLGVIVYTSSTLRNEWGVVDETVLPYWSILLLFTLTLFVVEDFNRFIVHFAYHRIPFLWEFHKVHHSAEVLTPITLYRSHPVEIFISRSASVLCLGIVTGVFVYLFPGQLSAIEILGVDLLGFIFNALGANLRHSHVPFSFGRFDTWFISPHMHQVHHSRFKQHHDKNFGSCFSIWDRLAGTLYLPKNNEPLLFGCNNGGKHTLSSQWFSPFLRLFKNPLQKPG